MSFDVAELAAFDRLTPLAFGAVMLFFALETWRPLRARVEPRTARVLRNASMGVLGAGVVRIAVVTTTFAIAEHAQTERIGLLPALEDSGIPRAVVLVFGFLCLDATMYGWHRLNHRLPWLWRFHRVHHVDLDLDVSTALRFHPGELILSVPFRALQTWVLGPTPMLALSYEIAMQVATAFHHSNSRLPIRLESGLRRAFVTPRMHEIHHSVLEHEVSSNWSVIFSFWDRLARTYRRDPRTPLTIGVPELQDRGDVTLGKMLSLPFTRQSSAGLV